MKYLITVFIAVFLHSGLFSQTLTLNFTGLRNSVGCLQIQFFDSQENFEKDKPLYSKRVAKSGLKNSNLSITYTDIKPGTYGIAILDDENNNRKMDYGMVLPKEGFGFSDYYHSSMSQPKYKNFCFTLNNQHKVVTIKLRYL